MPAISTRLRRGLWHVLSRIDAVLNRLYGSRYNPLYQSGSIVVALLVVVTVTGLYLIFFYRIGAPYESVAALDAQPWLGRWIRALHRYASDAAVLAAAVHALRLFAQGRSWGPRTLAWASGAFLLFLILVCGWTGYVMVWDVQGQVLAVEGARLLDALPIFSEPISRAFVGEAELPAAFFFLNLFLHIALPIGLGLLLWVHVSRVARPTLLPPRPLSVALIASLLVLSILWPAALGPAADPLRLPTRAPFDVFYTFWLPLTRGVPGWLVWGSVILTAGIVLAIPVLARPREGKRPAPSSVDERYCTGCEQCYLDCPYEAIAMVSRADERADLVARVDPALCVSCAICAGSCAPMGVGPPGRTGRDQLAAVSEFLERGVVTDDVVVATCDRSLPARFGDHIEGAPVYRVSCAGSLHSSVIEYLLRDAAGVLVIACPPRDCWNREGAQWLEQRLFHDREAELHARVDRRRVRLIHATSADTKAIRAKLRAFRAELIALSAAERDKELDLIRMCETASEGNER